MKIKRKQAFGCALAALIAAAAVPGAASAAVTDRCGGMDVAVANVSSELLIRDSASATGEVVGYLPSAAGVIVQSMDAEWTKVQSGSISGYVRTDYLAFGERADYLKSVYGVPGAVAAWDDVKVFSDYEDMTSIIGSVNAGEGFEVLGSTENWVEVQLADGNMGYIPAEDVKLTRVLETAVAVDDAVPQESAGASDTYVGSGETYAADDVYADSAYTDETYADDAYVSEAYTDETYTDETYADDSNAGDVYTDGSYADDSCIDVEYTDETYTDGSYTDGSYTDDSYTDGAYTDNTDTDSTYTDSTYTDNTYTDNTYTDNTYTDNTYTDNTYTDNTYTDNTYTDDTYTDDTAGVTDGSADGTDGSDDGADDFNDGITGDEYVDLGGEDSAVTDASADDLDLLAALIYCEAGNQSEEGKIAVGQVVMNRVESSDFAGTIHDVIYESGQFTPASTGWLDQVIGSAPQDCYDAAVAALNGEGTVGDSLYFNGGTGKGMQIGDHQFY